MSIQACRVISSDARFSEVQSVHHRHVSRTFGVPIFYGDLLSTLSDETLWLPNKETTKPCEVSDETSTNLFPHFQCLTLQCDPSTLKPRHGVVSDFVPTSGLTSEVSFEPWNKGGVFPKTTLNFLDSLQTRPDSTRPRPRSPIFISYPPSDPPSARPHTGEC